MRSVSHVNPHVAVPEQVPSWAQTGVVLSGNRVLVVGCLTDGTS